MEYLPWPSCLLPAQLCSISGAGFSGRSDLSCPILSFSVGKSCQWKYAGVWRLKPDCELAHVSWLWMLEAFWSLHRIQSISRVLLQGMHEAVPRQLLRKTLAHRFLFPTTHQGLSKSINCSSRKNNFCSRDEYLGWNQNIFFNSLLSWALII